MFGREDNTFNELTKNSTMQWLQEQVVSEDIVNKHGAKLTLEYIEQLNRKIQELEAKNNLKDKFLKKLKGQQKNT